MARRVLLVLPAVLVLGLLGVGLFRTRPPAELGRPAPDFAVGTLGEGRGRIRLSDLRGRPVLLNFWASWCDPCRDEAPQLAAAHRAWGERVAFLGVNILDGRTEALAFVDRFGIDYPSVRDPNGRVSKQYAVTGVPETVFIDSDGRVVGKFVGAFPDGRLEEIVRDLLRLGPGKVLRITGRGETRPVP